MAASPAHSGIHSLGRSQRPQPEATASIPVGSLPTQRPWLNPARSRALPASLQNQEPWLASECSVRKPCTGTIQRSRFWFPNFQNLREVMNICCLKLLKSGGYLLASSTQLIQWHRQKSMLHTEITISE